MIQYLESHTGVMHTGSASGSTFGVRDHWWMPSTYQFRVTV